MVFYIILIILFLSITAAGRKNPKRLLGKRNFNLSTHDFCFTFEIQENEKKTI